LKVQLQQLQLQLGDDVNDIGDKPKLGKRI